MLFGTVDALGRVARRAGWNFAELDADRFLEEARNRTGHEWYGGDGIPDSEFREGLRRFLTAAEREAALSPLGRVATREDVLRLLSNRLRLVADRRRHPEIAAVEVEAPVFIVGFPRTGTTLLHGLLGADPANRVPRTWEVMYPSPPPRAGTAGAEAASAVDARVEEVRRQLRWFDRMNPEYKVAHPIGSELPQECIEIQSASFLSERFWRTHHVPSYAAWLDARPLDESYEFHRLFLQHLGWRAPARGRWVLKNPPHTFSMPELHRVYPDARFIQTHRDPVTVMASFVSHTRILRSSFSDRPDRLEAEKVVERWARGMDRLLDFREGGSVPEDRWVDVRYPELLADPFGTVGRIYDELGFERTGEADRRMRDFLAAHPQHEHGVHRYSPESTGVDPAATRERFSRYRERFGIREPGRRAAS